MTMAARTHTEIGLGLGSNIGDKAGHVRRAAARLSETGVVRGLVLSSLYRTAPWGHVEQDWFVNACAWGTTDLAPAGLLARVKAIEEEIGRTATVRWGPRVIDIDILYVDGVELATPALTLPHKELLRRAFVLVPLAEIRPGRRIGGLSVSEAIGRLGPQDVVRLAAADRLDADGAGIYLKGQ